MRHSKAFHLIAQLRRHYGINGEDLLAIYDTAIAGHYSYTVIGIVSLATSKEVWDRLAANPNIEQVKHPGTDVPCLRMFKDVYLRKQRRVADEDVIWTTNLGCYIPSLAELGSQIDLLLASKSSTKKNINYAIGLNNKLMTMKKEHEWV